MVDTKSSETRKNVKYMKLIGKSNILLNNVDEMMNGYDTSKNYLQNKKKISIEGPTFENNNRFAYKVSAAGSEGNKNGQHNRLTRNKSRIYLPNNSKST